jgi:thiamine biosynthesis lipoprotein
MLGAFRTERFERCDCGRQPCCNTGARRRPERHSAIIAQTDRLFDSAIGGLIRLGGFQSNEFTAALPDQQQVQAWVAAKPAFRIWFLTITASAVGTRQYSLIWAAMLGYAPDRAALLLRQQGIENALITIGGNILAIGALGERTWR